MQLCAGTAAVRSRSGGEIDELTGVVDWSDLITKLDSQRLLPLLGERLIQLAADRVPEHFACATHQAIAMCSAQDAWLELLTIQLVDALGTDGIDCVPLKGPALGRALYGTAGRRPSGDIDLLVAREHLEAAIQVARRLGYIAPVARVRAERLPRLHFRLESPAGRLPPLELHWRVHWYETRFAHQLLERSAPGGRTGRRAAPADELVCLLLFYARDGFINLRLACDLATWHDTVSSCLSRHALAQALEDHPALRRVLLAALSAAERVVGFPASSVLPEPPILERRVRVAVRLANPYGCGSSQQRAAETRLVDWLLTPPGGHRECLDRQLEPSDHVEEVPSMRGDGYAAKSVQALRLIARYTYALTRLFFSAREPKTAWVYHGEN